MKSFSVITPAYNAEQYIETAIKSVLNQKYDLSKIEHIIIDDGSKDNTVKIVEKYSKEYSHIKLIRKENGQWGSVINYIRNNRIAKNQYIVILDSDDKFVKNAFHNINKKIGDRDMFIGSFYMWNGKKISIPYQPYYYFFRKKFSEKNKVCTLVMPTFAVFLENKFFYENAPTLKEKVAYQDVELFVTLMVKSKKLGWTTKKTGKYWMKRPGNTMSIAHQEKNILEWKSKCDFFAKNNVPLFVTFYLFRFKVLRKYLKENNLKIKINKKISFKWYPWIIRWIMVIQYKICFAKFFQITK